MRPVYLFLLVTGCLVSKAQERLGIANSNYSSTNGIFLNPTFSVDSKTYMQFNLVGVNAYAFTNSAYLPSFSVWQVRKTGGLAQPKLSTIKLKQFAYATAWVDGPAFVISKRNYGAGFFVRARSYGDIKRVPYQLTSLFINPAPDPNLPSSGSINLRNVKASNMSWVEYGGNFGIMIKKQRRDIIAIGGNLRYLTGINIFYADLSRVKGFYNDSVLSLDNLKGKLRYNTPAWNSGKGFGLDFGISYKKMLEAVDYYFANSTQSGCKQIDYKYKLSASLRDLGYINFKKGTTLGNVNASGYFSTARQDSSFKTQVESNFNTTLTSGKAILATLPTNLALQADWNFENGVYLNATLVKNLIPNNFTGVQAQDLVSICPRFEIKQVEVAMPLTFQRFIYPQLGMALRVRTFVIGFDNIFPLIYKKNTYGLNVYFSIGFSLFNNRGCRVKHKEVANCPPNILFNDQIRKAKRKNEKRKKDGWLKKWREKRQKKRST